MKDEICPECGGMNTLCSHPDYDGDSCPERRDDCDESCPHIVTCPICKGEGLVTLETVSRCAERMSKIIWGNSISAGGVSSDE